MKNLILIPAYNEQKNIGDIITKAKAYAGDCDVLVVDDGSSDKTSEAARGSGAIVARHPFNMGYGAALQTGYKYADKNGYDFVVQLDADGQHDPHYIKALLEEIKKETADVIIGSRFMSVQKYKAPFARRIGMFLFSKLVSFIIRNRITDSTSGYQALHKKVVKFLTRDIYPYDYPDADVIIMLHRAGFKIKEMPLVMYKNEGTKSMHSGFKPIYYVFKMVLSIFVTLLRRQER